MTNIVVVGQQREIDEFLAQASSDGVRYYPVDPTVEALGDGLAGGADTNGNGVTYDELHAVVVLDPAATGVLDDGIQALFDAGDPEVALLLAVPYVTATTVRSELPVDNPVAVFSWVPGISDLSRQVEYSVALQSEEEEKSRIAHLLGTFCSGDTVEVEDRIGHVSLRVLAMIINEAVFALQEGVASPSDIDTAMQLGTNYPVGPLEWCDRIGADVIVAILDGLQAEYGEERYRPAVLLRQYARAGRSFLEASGAGE